MALGRKKAVLSYSGGLDTTVCLKLLEERYGYDVIAVTVDVGQPRADIEEARKRAELLEAEHRVIDAREEFAREYIFRAIKANASYEGYPLGTALSRPLIAKKVVEVARDVGAEAVAHGCTGRGNDQFRIEYSIRALAPDLKIIAPIRELNLTRTEEIRYLRERGIPIEVTEEKPYSVDENLWSRSIEGGILEEPSSPPDESIFSWTRSPERAPEERRIVEIGFEDGVPVSLDGEKMEPVELIQELNRIAGLYGIGRIDMMEDRILGFKSREIYEAPAAAILLEAHYQLERLVLTRDELRLKRILEDVWSELVYKGLWFDPLREAIDAFIDKTQERVCGEVSIELHRGGFRTISRKSPNAIFFKEVSFEDKEFDQREVEPILRFFGLQSRFSWRTMRS